MLLLYHAGTPLIFCSNTDLHSIMLLLYRTAALSRLPKWPFTFHYASTLSGTAEFVEPLKYIYIPLCFYFINYTAKTSMRKVEFTFHYASTLSVSEKEKQTEYFRIYIPLCFYFIGYADCGESSQRQHLHSIMLLLYQRVLQNNPCKI